MKICSVCHRCYEDSVADCEENHGSLTAARLGSREMIANYRLDFLLERDATGETYRATRDGFDQVFIIKIFALNSTSDTAQRQKIQSEAQAVSGVNHPNIARVYEFGSIDSGEFYTVTEAVGGQTLRECLRKIGVLPEITAVQVAKYAAEALEAAHQVGVTHRAVSPANIILVQNNKTLSVKLQNFDFGGVRQQAAVADFSAIQPPIDALRYLAPEQVAGEETDARSDIYSLAVVLYEMLCGRSPFDAPTSTVISDRRINEKPLEQLSFDTRALLKHILRQSLQKRPEARPQTAGNFARQLRHIEQLLGLALPAPAHEVSQPSTANKPATEAVAFNAAPTPNSSESLFEKAEESRPREISTQEIAEPILQSTPVAATSVENVEEKTVYADASFSEPEPIRVEKRESRVDSISTEPLLTENEGASVASFESEPIRIKKKFEAEPIILKKKQVDADAFEPEPTLVEWKTADVVSTVPEMIDLPDADVREAGKTRTNAPIFADSLNENRVRHLPTKRPLFVGAGLLTLLVSVMLGAFLYNWQRQSAVAPPIIAAASPVPAASQMQEELALDTNDDTAEFDTAELAAPGTEEPASDTFEKSSRTASKRENQPREETATNDKAARQNESLGNRIAPESPAATEIADNNSRPRVISENGVAQAELNTSLGDWVTATNARNVDRQMNYYAPKMNAYYLTRNVSPDTVRAEKRRIFERADQVAIQTGKPQIAVSPDGKTATMRFRKKYVIRQGQQTRNGEVVQELRWVKSGGGWRIVSERDVKVINR